MEPILNTNQNLDMKDKPTKGIGKQPKFGVLRVLGDINKVDSTSTNNAQKKRLSPKRESLLIFRFAVLFQSA